MTSDNDSFEIMEENIFYNVERIYRIKKFSRWYSKKIKSVKKYVPMPISQIKKKNSIGLISYGSSDMAVCEAVDQMSEKGICIDYMRIRAIPFHKDVSKFLLNHENIFVVECNRDGQMKDILCMEFPQFAAKLISISHLNGLSLSAEWINKEISANL